MTLNFKYVVYESCQFEHLTIEKFQGNFFSENFKVLMDFLSKKIIKVVFLINRHT